MNRYPEWEDKKILIDLRNRYCTLYENEDGSKFYVEPAFYTALSVYKTNYPERLADILREMDRLSARYRLVVFTADDEEPLTFIPDGIQAVYLTAADICDRLQIFLEDKSRGSDYGD